MNLLKPQIFLHPSLEPLLREIFQVASPISCRAILPIPQEGHELLDRPGIPRATETIH